MNVKAREETNVGAGLWKGVGMWAWLLFRISGVILALYLFLHIIVISTGRWTGAGKTLNSLMKFFDHPALVVLDLALVVAVKVAEPLAQTAAEFTLTAGCGLTVSVTEAQVELPHGVPSS